MTLLDREMSLFDSEPLLLFKFVRGAQTWLFTSDPETWTAPDGIYLPTSIKTNEPSQDADGTHSTLTLEVPRDFPIALLFQGGAPGSSIWLTVSLAQRGLAETETLWAGKVRSASLSGSLMKLACDPLDKISSRATLRQNYGPQCSRRLYLCGVDPLDFTVDALVTGISADGMQLTSEAFGAQVNGWWLGGDVYLTRLDCRRMVSAHVGTTVTLILPITGVLVGDAVKIRCGCDHLWDRADGSEGHCKSRFSNEINFKGWPFTPSLNPFTTRIG